MDNFDGNPVLGFAVIMQKVLDNNEDKGGWEHCDMKYLLKRAKEELVEIEEAIKQNKSVKNIQKECADVANFMMMIADNYE